MRRQLPARGLQFPAAGTGGPRSGVSAARAEPGPLAVRPARRPELSWSSAAGPRHRGIRTESGGRHLPLPTGRACGPVLKAGRLGSDGVSLPNCVKGVAGCGDL